MKTISHWAVVFLILGAIGLADASFLTIKHYTGGPLPCVITTSCEAVTTSSYSKLAGIPVALLGSFNYLLIIILSVAVLDTKRTQWLRRLAGWTAVGFVFTLYFLFVQAFILQAYCVYCLISAGISTVLFITGIMAYRQAHHYEELGPVRS